MIPKETLQGIRDRETLYAFLRDELKWPVTSEDTFTYDIPITGRAATKAGVSRIVPFSAEDPFAIMLVEFQGEMRRADLREILREIRARIRKEHAFEGRSYEEIIFVCATRGYEGIRFGHFKEQEGKQPKLSVFGWDTDAIEETRTLRDFNLPALEMPKTDLFGAYDWPAARPRWMEAWNVEKVTKAFYKQYDSIFKEAEKVITGIEGDDKRLFTQKLFDRLLFIRFLEKKGWLIFGGRHDYLKALWEDHLAGAGTDSNFYDGRLKLLFYAGLNNDQEKDLMVVNNGGLLKDLIGDVPYLNGGLFDEDEDKAETAAYPNIHVPDDAFRRLLEYLEPGVPGLFYAYNFTVMESTPDDVEVAVDPEMLGRVFEELVTGRHDTGSYYTPRPVVSFMCREALKGYLRAALPDETETDIEAFAEERKASGLSNPEAVLDALRRVKVCDPACGSGAYLLGMLHELLDLRAALFTSSRLDPVSVYQRKLEVIENNVFGVDIDQFAVNIARLRLWLSLAVEYEGEEPEPLPNLDFKIERGDSVSVCFEEGGIAVKDMFRRNKIEQYMRLKADFLTAHGSQKTELRCKVEGMRADIAEWSHPDEEPPEFDWMVDFADVFYGGGFDIVLANPPYVRHELIKELKPALKKAFGELFCGMADLYVYFYIRGVQLLRPGGMLVFISSNKWFRADYGAGLRDEIATQCTVSSITDFGELPVFKAATFPMIFVAQKGIADRQTLFTQVKSLEEPYPDIPAIIRESGQVLPPTAIAGPNWVLADAASADRLRKMEKAGIPLGEYVKGGIFYGLKTGCDKAFIVDTRTMESLVAADPKCAEVFKPLIHGDAIRKWAINRPDAWLIFAPWGFRVRDYPSIGSHLARYKDALARRPEVIDGRYPWYCLARYGASYHHRLSEMKIVYPEIAMSPRFAFDTWGAYTLKTVFSLPTRDLFLLGLLNSGSVWHYLKSVCSVLGDAERRGRLTLQEIYVGRVPVPSASELERNAISALVQKCLDAKGIGVEEWEREIDERVAALYGL